MVMADSRSQSHLNNKSSQKRRRTSPSPHRDRHHRHRHSRPGTSHDHSHTSTHDINKHSKPRDSTTALPYDARPLFKNDYSVFRPIFASYLDIQKSIFLDELSETERKGRWKSFLGKWNRGELAEGWYDPVTLAKASTWAKEGEDVRRDEYGRESRERREEAVGTRQAMDGSSSEDEMGPALPPGNGNASSGRRAGPMIPNMQDLEMKREAEQEDRARHREDRKHELEEDRKLQKAQLEDLVPRAAAGTRERALEKKAEVNATMKAFRERSPAVEEVPDTELMGGGDGVGEFKAAKQEFERKKNERELRREEVLRARAAEREERLKEYRSKEEETMEMFRALAKSRFG